MADLPVLAEPEALPRPSSALVLALRGLVLLFAAFISLGFAAQLAHLPFGLWFTQLFLFLGLTACLVRRSGRDPLAYPGLTWIGAGPVVVGFLLGVANFLTVIAPLQYVTFLIVPEALKDTADRLLFERQSPVQLAIVLGAVTLAAPLCEEYFFRGVFQQGLRLEGARPLASVLITAAVFSIFHMQTVKLLPLFELGVLFGVLRLRTGSLWPAIAAHSGNNSITALLFLSGMAEDPQAAEAMPEPRAIALAAGVGGFVILALMWGWRRFPRLMPFRAAAAEPVALPPVSAKRVYGRWVAGMLASIALLLAVDWREVRLNYFDFVHGLPELPEGAPLAERERRKELEALRVRAERGEAPLEEYFEARKQLSPRRRPELPKVPPVEPVPPAEVTPAHGG